MYALDGFAGNADRTRLAVTVRDREARALLCSTLPPREQEFDLLDDPDEWITAVHKAPAHSIDQPEAVRRGFDASI